MNANDNFLSVLGYERDEIKGRHHRMFVDPDYAASADYAAFWDSLRRGQYQSADFKRFGKGGKEVWIQASYNPIFDDAGKVSKVIKFATDLTDRMGAIQELGDALSRLADGNLEQRITNRFIPSLEALRAESDQSAS